MAAAETEADDGREDADTVTYQFEMREDDWREWVDQIPRDEPISERLKTVIEADTVALRWGTGHGSALTILHANDVDVTLSEQAWGEWKASVPRSESLDGRLRTLLVQDANASEVPDGEVAQYDTRTAATRIRVKAAGALSAVRDRDEPGTAIEKLSVIHDIADALESA